MKLGAHLSISGGNHNALQKIVTIGGNALQIFSSSPRIWIDPDLNDEQIEQFTILKKSLGVDPIYFHATYLINLADSGRIGELSKKTLIEELRVAEKLGIKGSIVHTGSFKDANPDMLFPIIITNLQEILAQTPPTTLLILENAGNKKIGQKLDDLAKILEAIDSPRLRICLDTCHLFSSGYEFSTKEKLDSFLTFFDSLIGLEKLELIHLNDSRDPFASGRDRHENIGEGTLGIDTFKLVLNHPQLKNIPFIIETPGFDKKGPDKKNLDIVKSLLL
jgi:apurinic endonuclease APN1